MVTIVNCTEYLKVAKKVNFKSYHKKIVTMHGERLTRYILIVV